MPVTPAGHDVFQARIQRIQQGRQMVGEGLKPNPALARNRRRRGGGIGRLFLVAVLGVGGVSGAVASGHGPEGLDQQLFAWSDQVQATLLEHFVPMATQAAGLVTEAMPQG
jgi:hypothetical protein